MDNKAQLNGQPESLSDKKKFCEFKETVEWVQRKNLIAWQGIKKTSKCVFWILIAYGVGACIVIPSIYIYRGYNYVVEMKSFIEDVLPLKDVRHEIRVSAAKSGLMAQEDGEALVDSAVMNIVGKYFPAIEVHERNDGWNVNLSKLKFIPKETPEVIRTLTAYNSVPGQTDGTPCIAASGNNICALSREGSLRKKKGLEICASNAYDMGAVIEVRRVDKSLAFKCIVLDTMNRRFNGRLDLFLDKDIERAVKQIGEQKLWMKQVGFYTGFKDMARNNEPTI